MSGLYGRRWQTFRRSFLRNNPLCKMCFELGKVESATVVDHIKPHKGSYELFWQEGNHQSLCKPCHDRHKQRIEKGGAPVGCNTSGLPLDPEHHWNG